MSPLPVSAFRIEHIVTVQPDEGLRIGVEGIPQRFVIHYFNIINSHYYTDLDKCTKDALIIKSVREVLVRSPFMHV